VTSSKDRAEVNRISTAGGDPASVPRGKSVNQTVLDRRRTHRHKLCIPLHLRIRGSVDLEQLAHSVDISERGVLLETDLPLRMGLAVDMRLVFHGEITGERTAELHCLGRVVRIVSRAGEAKPFRAGVRFDHLRALRVEGC
jgi:PilZ domain